MLTIKKAKVARLISVLAQGLDLSAPLVWSRTRCHLTNHGLPTLVLSLRTTSYEADRCSSLTDHWQDVLAGSFLGIITAYFSYRQYFPSLASDLAHLPYAPRTQHLEDTHGHPAPGLPYYRSAMESEGGEAAMELLHDTVKRNEPERVEQTWERGPSLEEGPHHI